MTSEMLIDDPAGLAFVTAVDGSTDTQSASFWIVDERLPHSSEDWPVEDVSADRPSE